MDQRAIFLKAFRGETIGNISEQSSSDELFQNEVLRPILKLQNDLVLAVFLNYFAKNKMAFKNETPEKKRQRLKMPFKKTSSCKIFLKA